MTCKVWLADISMLVIKNDGWMDSATGKQTDRQMDVHMMTIPLGRGVINNVP